MPGPVPLVRVIRSGVEEAVHRGSIAVADEHGSVVASAGDPERVAFARSSTKPLQAAVSLNLAGEEVTDAEVAVMCASHSGESVHVEAVRRLLGRAGLGFAALRCPSVLPLDPEAATAVSEPRPEYHDCSGKHAGMLLACARRGFDLNSYFEPTHPLQQEVSNAVAIGSGAPPVAVGVDGCGVPVHALPLVGLATMYARLARPAQLGSLALKAERAVRGMLAEPYLVAGRDRICTVVMQAVPGVVVKVGAEGLLCAAILEEGLGIALKIEDGSGRARPPVLIRSLRLLGVLDREQEHTLEARANPPVFGGSRPVGEIRAEFDLVSP